MEVQNHIAAMLHLLPQPAFLVENGTLSHMNQAAAGYFLQVGQPVAPLILHGSEEYANFTDGCLYLTLTLEGQSMGASVSKLENAHLFVLEQQLEVPQLQALALAAMELREPLSGILTLADQMLPGLDKENEALQLQAAQINRRLYQMLRIIGNMSDAAQYAKSEQKLTYHVEICNFLREILEKATALAEQAGIHLAYELPSEPIFTLASEEKLERAIYNLLSNAMKFAPTGSTVQAKLSRKGMRLYFSVTNRQDGSELPGNLFARYLRQPGLEDPRSGVGLGMVLVRTVAALHGGAVLADQVDDCIRITLSMQIRQSKDTGVRSPVLRIDYAGERDHGLIELSDVLPAAAYETDQIN